MKITWVVYDAQNYDLEIRELDHASDAYNALDALIKSDSTRNFRVRMKIIWDSKES